MKKFRFLKDHKVGSVEYKSGTIAEMSEADAKSLPEGVVEAFTDVPMIDQKGIESIVAKAIKDASANSPHLHITVGHTPEDDGFATLGQQLQAQKDFALTGKLDKRQDALGIKQKAAYGLNEAVDSEGGFLLQPQFGTELFQLAFQTGMLADQTDKVEIGEGKNSLTWNAVDETSRVDGSRRGGLTTYWTNEAADFTGSKPKFAQRSLKLEKLTGLYYATDELLEDSTALQSMVTGWFGEEFGFKLDDAVLRGKGGGQPLGILNSPALVSVAKETAQAADTIIGQNIIKMYARMWSKSMANAVWFINQDIIPQLFTLTIPTGSTTFPIYMPANGISGAPYGTLFGRPVMAIEQASTLGDLGDIVFADMKQYMMIRKAQLKADSSIHVRFVQGETAFRFSVRANGESKWRLPLTPYKGSATQSPFIALAERA